MAARFWVTQPVSGAVVSIASAPQVRLTVSSTTGMTTGDTRTVFGIVGTTEANGTWVITVIDGTHIDLQGTTFANVYISGGSVNGRWDTTNTNNWVTTTGGTNYGQTVPSSADSVTLDASSGGGTVTVNATISITTLTMGQFGGTLDFSANNNNITLSGVMSITGTGTRTLNMGNGNWTLSAVSGNFVDFTVITGLTFNANSSNMIFSGLMSATNNIILGTGLTYNTLTFNAQSTKFGFQLFNGAGTTITSMVINAPNTLLFLTGVTLIINGMSTSGASLANPIYLGSTNAAATATISRATGTTTLDYCVCRLLAATGGATFNATNSIDLGRNTGLTFTTPSAGGNIAVIGC